MKDLSLLIDHNLSQVVVREKLKNLGLVWQKQVIWGQELMSSKLENAIYDDSLNELVMTFQNTQNTLLRSLALERRKLFNLWKFSNLYKIWENYVRNFPVQSWSFKNSPPMTKLVISIAPVLQPTLGFEANLNYFIISSVSISMISLKKGSF